MREQDLDQEDQAVLDSLREVRGGTGHGRLEIVIREGHVDTIHETKTRKGKDYNVIAKKLLTKV